MWKKTMVPNRTDKAIEFLLHAIDSFDRRILVISPDYEILAANAAAIEDGSRDLIGRSCYEVFAHSSEPCPDCPADEVMRTGKVSLRYNQLYDSGGSEKMMCLFAYPIFDQGEIKALVMLDFDLTSLKEIEEKQHQSNAFLRNLLNSAVDAIIASDPSGRILIFNEAAEQILGYTRNEALNEISIRDVYPGNGAREVMQMLLSEAYGGCGKLKSYHINARQKNGDIVPISLNASIVYDADGNKLATIGFFHDRRDEIRMQKELENTQVQLLQSEKMASLGKMAAGVAHQLNNPLSGIILYAKLVMEEYNLPDGAMEDLERVLDDAQRAKETVKELLEFARQTNQEMKPQDVNEIVSRTVFLLENQSIFYNIEIKKEFGDNLPPINGDAQQLNHVFMNLILNAADAMGGTGTLTIKTGYLSEPHAVLIEVADTGEGIREEVLPHIFEPFYTTKEQGKGTGLGLSMVYGILESHGGTIRAESTVGKGTRFFIELPAIKTLSEDEKIG